MNEKASILIVDDDAAMGETLLDILEDKGFNVAIAKDGPTAVAEAGGRHFDLALIDIMMPGMNGVETLRELRERDPDLQVMLLSGQSTIKTAVEAMRLGAVEVFEKPTDIETLLEKIREARARALELAAKRSSEAIDDILRKRGW